MLRRRRRRISSRTLPSLSGARRSLLGLPEAEGITLPWSKPAWRARRRSLLVSGSALHLQFPQLPLQRWMLLPLPIRLMWQQTLLPPLRLMLRSPLRLLKKKKSPPPRVALGHFKITKAPKAPRLWSPTLRKTQAVGSNGKAEDVLDAEGALEPASFFSA